MPMPVTVTFHPNETPHSAASRLAAANGYSSVRQFLAHVGLKAKHLDEGEFAAIDRLSTLSGVPSPQLARFSFRPVAWGIHSFGGAKIRKRPELVSAYRICPCCVVEDRETGTGHPLQRPYYRCDWLAPGIEHCLFHGVSLLYHETDGDFDFARFVEKCWDAIAERSIGAKRVNVPSMASYVSARITGKYTNEFLDGLELYVALDLFQVLGRFLGKRTASIAGMSESERGFTVASGGEAAIDAAVADAIAYSRPTAYAVRGFIGPLVEGLRKRAGNPSYHRLNDMLQDIAVRRLPLGTEHVLFKPVERRILHSVRSASQDYDVTERKVRALVLAAGLAADPTMPNSRLWFDAEMARPHLEAVGIPDSHAAPLLGIDKHHVAALRASDVFHVNRNRIGGRNSNRLHLPDVEALKDAIFAHATPQEDSDDTCGMTKAALRAKCKLATVVKLARDGSLTTLRSVDSSRLLSSFRVDWKEVREAVAREGRLETKHSVRPGEMLAPLQIGKELGVSVKMANQLIKGGHLPSESHTDPFSGCRKVLVSPSAIQSFLSTHIRLSEIAYQLKISKAAARALLEANSISAKLETGSLSSAYYMRSEVAGLLR